MFWSSDFLGRKGPLGRMWLAGTLKKLSKRNITNANLVDLSDYVMNPSEAFALPVSGTLLLGLAIICEKKSKYLLEDVHETLGKVRVSITTDDSINMPARKRKVKNRSAPIPRIAASDFPILNEIDFDVEEDFIEVNFHPPALELARARAEDITLPDDNFLQPDQWGGIRKPLQGEEVEGLHDFSVTLLPDELRDQSGLGDSLLRIPDDAGRIQEPLPDDDLAFEALGTAGVRAAAATDEADTLGRKRGRTAKRKRFMLVDDSLELTSPFIKASLKNTSDTLTKRPSRKAVSEDFDSFFDRVYTYEKKCAFLDESSIMNLQPERARAEEEVSAGTPSSLDLSTAKKGVASPSFTFDEGGKLYDSDEGLRERPFDVGMDYPGLGFDDGYVFDQDKRKIERSRNILQLFEAYDYKTFQQAIDEDTNIKNVAMLFHDLLFSFSRGEVKLNQSEPFGEISVTLI